jgi:hypothetical protein
MTDPTQADEDVGETTETLEDALEKGFLGTHQDPEPNESYTFAEQAKNMPEPGKTGGAPSGSSGETGTKPSKATTKSSSGS